MPRVLFVCTGNTCRSPMAEAFFRRRLKASVRGESWEVGSAGTRPIDGSSATGSTVAAMRAYGLDLGSHRAGCVSAELLARYDLILTMEAGQLEALRIEFPGAAPRVQLFSDAAGSGGDVADPIGQPPEVYQAVAAEIEALIEQGFDRLCQLALTLGASAV